jgi:REP element-mobilizing transposase RayT
VAQTCGNAVVHMIFSTKLREPLIAPGIRSELFAYLGGILRELRGTAIIINGTCDHVHLLIRIRPLFPSPRSHASSRQIRQHGSERKATRNLLGRLDMACSVLASQASRR